MKRIVFRSLAGQPIVINKDTQFEVGDTTLEPALGGPRTRVLRAGDVIEEAAKGAANTAFDPNKRDQFAHYVSILCAFHDAGLGTSDTSEEVAQPANGHKVGPTARALLASEAEMATELPVSYRLFDWASLRAKVEHLEEVTTIRDQVAVRLENLTILQAQERQEIMADLTWASRRVWALGSSRKVPASRRCAGTGGACRSCSWTRCTWSALSRCSRRSSW